MQTTAEASPGSRLLHIAGRSVFVSVSMAIVFGLLTSPVFLFLTSVRPRAGGYAVLGLLGWGLFMGYEFVTDDRGSAREFGDELYVRVGLGLVALLYYNLVLFVAVFLAFFTANAGLPGLAALVALGYPAYDVKSVNWGVPVSVAGVFAGMIVAGAPTFRAAASANWKEFDPAEPMFRFFESDRRELN